MIPLCCYLSCCFGCWWAARAGIAERDCLLFVQVLVTEDNRCKISDFGISRAKDSTEFTGMAGNLRWLAPELMRREPYDERVDIFCFGLIAWQVRFTVFRSLWRCQAFCLALLLPSFTQTSVCG